MYLMLPGNSSFFVYLSLACRAATPREFPFPVLPFIAARGSTAVRDWYRALQFAVA